MLPVTGPTYEVANKNFDGVGSYRWRRTKYRQKKPVDRPLAFLREYSYTVATAGSGFGGMANATTGKSPGDYYAHAHTSGQVSFINTAKAQAMNAARAKFIDELGPASEMLVNLAERAQSVEMLAKRASQLLKFSRAIRRFDFHGAGKALGVLQDPRYHRLRQSDKLRYHAKSAAGNWLEFWFGWSPLVADIGNAVEHLQSGIPALTVTGKRTVANPLYGNGYQGTYYKIIGLHSFKVNARVQAEVAVINPNLWLANRLGFTNPLGVAWELVPFSFVVDWFYPVSDFLGQWTDTAGLKVQNAFHTYKVQHTCTRQYWQRSNTWGPFSTLVNQIQSQSHVIERNLGIPSVTLVTRAPWRLSVTRAATSISLLLQLGLKDIASASNIKLSRL